MQHSPDYVKPRDVEEFHPKDRHIVELIDLALRGEAEIVPVVDTEPQLTEVKD